MTDDATLQHMVRDQFLDLARLLEHEPEAVWDEPSLCSRWRTREVVAHMTMAARYPPEAFMAELRADDGDMGHLIDRIAERDGGLEPAALLSDLRDPSLHRWTPPGGGQEGALTHVVIHSLDVAVPLGLAWHLPSASLPPVLDLLAAGGLHEHFGVGIDGLALHATDTDWSHGTGRWIAAPATDLVALLSGRTIAAQPERSLV